MATPNMLLILSILLPVTVSAQCVLTQDPENVVGTQLAGDWAINLDLTTQLWPEEDCGSWMDSMGQLFLAGEMTFNVGDGEDNKMTFPYVLTSNSGNPHLIYWTDEMTDVESFNLMIARAEDRTKDMLFIGGDFNNQAFTAWKRME